MKTLNKTSDLPPQYLRKTNAQLLAALAQKDDLIEKLQRQNQQLIEQFRLAQHKQFGKSSEANVNQGELFNEAEMIVEAEEANPSSSNAEDTTPTINEKSLPKGKPLPADLPREVIVHDITEEEKTCGSCGNLRHPMGEVKSEQLEFVPATIKVIEHVRLKYSCRHCETQGEQTKIQLASLPARPIPKSIATSSLLAQIITSKYQYALPLYRQESLFKQHGIELSRSTMSIWMLKSAALLQPVYDRLKEGLLQQPVIQADETPLNVINEDKSQCYMWLYCSGTDKPKSKTDPPDKVQLPNSQNTIEETPVQNIVLYDYQNSRAGKCAVEFLQDFRGDLQVDGYKGYEQTHSQLAGCMAHARRKFIEAQRVEVKGKVGKADWAINHIKKLYVIEKHIQHKTAEEKQRIRQEKAKPLLDQMKKWLDKSAHHVLPKTAIGKAVQYSLNQWDKLTRYIENGHLAIDNNRAERAIKPFVIGRKNWLFSQSSNGAHASAVLYSLIEIAKANGLVPYDYLNLLLEEAPKKPTNLDDLLPWHVKLSQGKLST